MSLDKYCDDKKKSVQSCYFSIGLLSFEINFASLQNFKVFFVSLLLFSSQKRIFIEQIFIIMMICTKYKYLYAFIQQTLYRDQKKKFDMVNFTCKCQSPAEYICVSKECQRSAFQCSNKQCEFCRIHQGCKVIKIDDFNKLYSEQGRRQGSVFDAICNFYDQFLKEIKQQADTYNEWLHGRYRKEKNLLLSKKGQQITGKYVSEIIDGWLNTDEDFCQEVKQFLHYNQINMKKEWQEMQEVFNSVRKRVEDGKNPRNSRNSNSFEINSAIIWKEEDLNALNRILTADPYTKVKHINELFHARSNKFSAAAFHEICDGKSNTLVISKNSKGKIIGGFTPLPWQNHRIGVFKEDLTKKSYIFSITDEKKYHLVEKEYAIECNQCCGPVFGKGAFWIEDNSNKNETYWSSLPCNYLPSNKTEWTQKSYAQFIGAQRQEKFTIQDWEVFEVTFY